MVSWTAGYVAEIGYTHGYYRELAPAQLELAALLRGQPFPAHRPLRYLELGYGQGLSLNIHAASCEGEFWGTDFNPSHAANASDLAAHSGSGLRTLDQAFDELGQRPDLPEFDVIALHGIWSWISPQNRNVIVDIARRKLAVGGLLYISYNCTPGWSAGMPLRHLMALHAEKASGTAAAMAPRIDAALAFAQRVVDSGAAYFKANPGVAEKLARMKDQDRHYLAHEFFNADWHPMPFSEVAACLANAKLEFAASANLLDHVDNINLPAEGRTLLGEIDSQVLRETVRDYLVNQQFRKDIWIKGGRAFPAAELKSRLLRQRFALLAVPADIPTTINGVLSTINLFPDVSQPVINALAADGFKPKTIERIGEMHPKLTFNQIREALILLCGAGYAAPAQAEQAARKMRPRAEALNAHLIRRAHYSSDSLTLASPVLGAGISVNRLQQLFIHALKQGRKQPEEWAAETWAILQAQGHRVLRDGKLIDGADENIAELVRQAREFATKRLPVLAGLHVV